MSPMHSDHHARALLDDRRRYALAMRSDRGSRRWRTRAGHVLVRAGDGLRATGTRLQREPVIVPTVAADGC